MLQVRALNVHYAHVHALQDVSVDVREGEIVALIGNNGAGKSTLLRTISGLLRPTSGTIEFRGKRIDGAQSENIVRMGISLAPEGRRLFARSTVFENLEMGAYVRRDRKVIEQDLDEILERFPILRQRHNQLAGTLSGGEQQMLCIARALMSRPRLLMLDEPSLGLMPTLVNEVMQIIAQVHRDGTTVLLVEQNARKALAIVDRGFVIETGKIILSGTADELRSNDQVRKAYLGEE